jgi:hypothetical protein
MMGPELTREPGREEEPCGDLGLAAFRYIAAEMSAGEAEAFELRLAEDHSAREAVAEMVQLSELASAALRPLPAVVPSGSSRGHWLAPLTWMSAGAAACLALIAGLYGLMNTPEGKPVAKVMPPQIAAPAKLDHVALVRRTAELRDIGLGAWTPDAALNTDETLLGMAAEVQDFDAELTVPDWLVAAVSISSSDCIEIQEN